MTIHGFDLFELHFHLILTKAKNQKQAYYFTELKVKRAKNICLKKKKEKSLQSHASNGF